MLDINSQYNDSASSTDDAAVTINVVANDTDSDGKINPASVQIVSQPAHGSVSVSQSGSVVYTPNAGYAGSDSFTYTDSDNQGATSNPATVTITVTAAKTSSSGGGGGGAMNLFELLVQGAPQNHFDPPRSFVCHSGGRKPLTSRTLSTPELR